MRNRLFMIFLSMASIQACVGPSRPEAIESESKILTVVDAAVDSFHSMANSERYKDIYFQSSDYLKSTTTEPEWEQLLHSVRVIAGTVTATHRIKWNLKQVESRTYLDTLYDSTTTNGDLKEEFIYEISGDHVSLAGYHFLGKA